MIRLTQRQINHGAFGLMTGVALFALGILLVDGAAPGDIAVTILYCLICGVLWFAYWRGWEYARHTLIALLTGIVALGVPEAGLRQGFVHLIYLVPVLALVLTSPLWIFGSAVIILVSFAVRVGGGAYANPVDVGACAVIIGGMIFSRLAVDNTQRLSAANQRAEEALARAEQQGEALAEQARTLVRQNTEQQRLLDLVVTLETPTIAVADGVVLAPVVGTLDSRRAQMLTTRLLEEAKARRARQVILDVAGVMMVDSQVAHELLQTARALRLLGCQVTLTGISASVATTLTQLGIVLDGVSTARSPQEVLGHL